MFFLSNVKKLQDNAKKINDLAKKMRECVEDDLCDEQELKEEVVNDVVLEQGINHIMEKLKEA